MYLKTNQYHIAQFAYLTQRMKDIKEGETTLLDNSILVCASSLFDGDAHSANQLPILLTGKGGGTLKTGPHPRLPREGRRQPQGVQPAPVAHGSHGREARKVRGCVDAAGGALVLAGGRVVEEDYRLPR